MAIGNSLLEDQKQAPEPDAQTVWDQAEAIPGFDPERYRISADEFRATIRRDRFDAHRRAFGWTVKKGKAVYAGHVPMMAALAKSIRNVRR